MTSRSNAYAYQIAKEHPIALWALDDDISATSTVSNVGSLGSLTVAPAAGHDELTTSGYYVNPGTDAKNYGVPMVYGAYNSTVLYSNSPKPSLLIPANGFLIEYGRNFNLTVEMWLNINNRSTSPKRIFGPIGSTDGIYVDGSFIGLKIGNNYSSHFVGEWGRPMLIHVGIANNFATMMINSEQVVGMNIDMSTIDLADDTASGNSQDWLGFYCYDDVGPILVDCIAIYAYQVSSVIAKRRFVYGQGTQALDTVFTSYSSTPAAIDYSFSRFGKNRVYPDIFRWENGYINNLEVDANKLSVPAYSLPTISIKNKTVDQWKAYQDSSGAFMKIRNTDETGYLVFDNFDFTLSPIRGFYGVFKYATNPGVGAEEQILFKLENQLTKDAFEIVATNTSIVYRTNYTPTSVLKTVSIPTAGTEFVVGVDLADAISSSTFGTVFYNLFSDRRNLKVYVGGYADFTKTFTGSIYKIGLYDDNNYQRLNRDFSTAINSDGSFALSSSVKNHTASYTLFSENRLGFFDIDIAVNGYWEDIISLSSLSSRNISGEKTLDYLQFNINYPEAETVVDDTVDYIDTSAEIVKTYVSFQRIDEGANDIALSLGTTANTVKAPAYNVVSAPTDLTKRYEVINDTIIYRPANTESLDFLDYALVVHTEFTVDGILKKPVKIRSLEIASRIMEDNELDINTNQNIPTNAIGTKFGKDIYPVKIVDGKFDYKTINPVILGKHKSQYLYMTKHTGIRLVGEDFSNRFLRLFVNEGLAGFYQVSTMQFAMRYEDLLSASSADIKIFEITGKSNKKYRLYLDPQSTTDANIVIKEVINGVDTATTNVSVYLNGELDATPSIDVREWFFVGLRFQDPISFDGIEGTVDLYGPVLFNNVVLYTVPQSEITAKVVFNPWSSVDGPLNDVTWNYWQQDGIDPGTDPDTWGQIISTSGDIDPTLNPAIVYSTYVGSNTIIGDSYSIDGNVSGIVFSLQDYEYSVKTDIELTRNTYIPV
jgi:hypothetical protein